jgi:hypothetical protein
MDEILFLLKNGFTYQDILIIPIHERRNFVGYLFDLQNG